MVISRTPFRISFFGGGTDYPEWFQRHGGAVLSTAINKYCYITCRYLPPFFEHRIRIVWSKIENCQTPDEIAHPTVREALKLLNIPNGVEIHHDADLPARSGTGSSSAFVVGLLNGLYSLLGQMRSKEQLAEQALYVERTLAAETVGVQDHYSAAFGGFNYLEFHQNGHVSVRPITLPPERMAQLNSQLMLFYTGIARTASNVAATYVNDLERKERQLFRIRSLVDEAMAVLCGTNDLRGFGDLLDETWAIKRGLDARISNDDINEIYTEAKAAGAVGGKLLGAGKGGFMVLFVPRESKEAVRKRLRRLLHVPFRFEPWGSQIIFYHREEDFSPLEYPDAREAIAPFREAHDSPRHARGAT